MNFFAVIGRLIVISLAFFIACIVAMGVIALGVWQSVDLGAAAPDIDPLAWFFNVVLVASFTVMLIGTLTVAPAAVAMVIAEIFTIRSWIYHTAAGAAVAALPLVMQTRAAAGSPEAHDSFAIMLYLAAGLAGGLVYWLLAGRSAGLKKIPG